MVGVGVVGEDLGYDRGLTGSLHVELQVVPRDKGRSLAPGQGLWPGPPPPPPPRFLLSASSEHPASGEKHAASLIILSSSPVHF